MVEAINFVNKLKAKSIESYRQLLQKQRKRILENNLLVTRKRLSTILLKKEAEDYLLENIFQFAANNDFNPILSSKFILPNYIAQKRIYRSLNDGEVEEIVQAITSGPEIFGCLKINNELCFMWDEGELQILKEYWQQKRIRR